MAIIEEVSDDERDEKAVQDDDLLIEELPDEPHDAPSVPTQVTTPVGSPSSASSPSELGHVLRQLSLKLVLPEELLPSFMGEDKPAILTEEYRTNATATLNHIASGTRQESWKEVPFDEQASIISEVVRLKGEDPWTSAEMCSQVDDIVSNVQAATVADYILTHTLRPLFVSHPHLSATSDRARSRALGGSAAMDDVQEHQAWKGIQGWGCYNALAWSVTALDDAALLRRLGTILPPTLMMMDDWEPQWRGRGAWVLSKWVDRIGAEELARRGLDKLLLSSLTHTLSLHANPPLKHVLPAALAIVHSLEGKKKADAYSEIVDRALVAGWTYAPSGAEGRLVLIDIAANLETICKELGTGIARWLKAIIPALLEPVQHPPTSASLPLFRANLSALHTVLVSLRGTGRVARWRGQILDVGARLWVQIGEREYINDGDEHLANEVRRLTKEVFAEVEKECPGVKTAEFDELLHLNEHVFSPLVAA